MSTPSINLKNYSVTDHEDHGLIKDEVSGRSYRIGVLDTLFLRHIDGSKDVTEIHHELSVLLDYDLPREALWQAFDRLSDIGILSGRLCPPAGGQKSSRRKFMSSFTAMAATGSALATNLASTQSNAESTAKQSEQSAKQQAELDVKGQEQNTKAPSEQDQKQQQQAEQKSKQQSEAQSKSANNEIQNKEMQIKNDNNNPPASVSEPAAITILGLGLASLALRKQRMKVVASVEKSSDTPKEE